MTAPPTPVVDATLGQIFRVFLVIGATSFGGGVMAYLRSSLVEKRGWIDDPTFVQMLAMSQSLPGLNSTNMAVLVGDRLRGTMGAVAALAGICLPGGLMMVAIGMIHRAHGARPEAIAMLHGVAGAAVGLVAAVAVQIGRKVLTRTDDLVFIALAIIGVSVLHQSVLLVLAVVGGMGIWWYRPRAAAPESPGR